MRYSIQHKILLSFSVVAFVGLTALLMAVYHITEQNTARIVKKDMIEARNSLDMYFRQYFLINNIVLDAANLDSEASPLAKGLGAQMGGEVALYAPNGGSLTAISVLPSGDNGSLSRAVSGETAYTVRSEGGKVTVSLSFPIASRGETLGIMKFTKDYSVLYHSNRRFESIITLFAVGIFVFIFLTSVLISRRIAKPIRMLTRSTELIAKGDLDQRIPVLSRDETGELAERFQAMLHRIREQIGIIRQDRDALKEAQSQSKAFFDNVTHELKTPLTTILGYAQVLKENGFSDPDFFDKGTTSILDETRRLNHMVIDILELSRVSLRDFSYHFEDVDISELVRQTCEEMGLKGKKYNIGIDAFVEDHLVVRGDRDKLKEVLINLIDNSIKYGRVNSSIQVEACRQAGRTVIKVRDRGDGIPEEHLEHLFAPFYRVSKKEAREKGSAGLGLSIVKSIVDSHGGDIRITSALGEGTEVLVCFGGGECE